MNHVILGIDFDGTLADHRYPLIGPEAPHAITVLKRVQKIKRVRLMLWTMRSDGRDDGTFPLTEAVEWCRKRGIEFWGVNQSHGQAAWTQSPKQYAHVYIDDAAIGCPLIRPADFHRPVVDWARVEPALMRRIESLIG